MMNDSAIPPDVSVDRSFVEERTLSWQLPLLLVLFVLVVFVSVKTIEHRHVSRTSFVQLQLLEKERDKLLAQWSRLKLEQGTVLNQIYVEKQARQVLGMEVPRVSNIRRLREEQVIVVSKPSAGFKSVKPIKVSLSD